MLKIINILFNIFQYYVYTDSFDSFPPQILAIIEMR